MRLSVPVFVGFISVASIVGYAVFLIYVTWPITSMSISNAGVFGDSFGVLTSLFSALAFVGVVWTLNYQRDEFKLQKEELADSKKEIAKQGFENSFFQMLKIQNDIVNGVTFVKRGVGSHERLEGRDAFKELSISLHLRFVSLAKYNKEVVWVNNAYDSFYEQDGYRLAHYFRFLYNIFRFLEESRVENKELYVRLLRAQISNQELFLIYYNALNRRGEKFKRFIAEYKLMDNLPVDELADDSHKHFLPNTQFYFN